ncbi:hypothetical protein Q1J45_15745 [Pseudomonas rhodesiae]
MSIDIKFNDFKYDLELMLSASELGLDAVLLIFHDVSALELNGFGGGLTQFMHLEAARVDNGLDRICSGLMKPDTHLGENARQIEVSDDQTTPLLYS